MCKYCEEEKKIMENENDNIYFYLYGRVLRLCGSLFGNIPIARNVAINYCPMCGKNLMETYKSELKEAKEWCESRDRK